MRIEPRHLHTTYVAYHKGSYKNSYRVKNISQKKKKLRNITKKGATNGQLTITSLGIVDWWVIELVLL